MADRRGAIVPLLILAFIFLTPSPGRGPVQSFDYRQVFDDAVAEEERQLSVLQNSTYIPQRFNNSEKDGLKLAGLEPERGYVWSTFAGVQIRAKAHARYALYDPDEDDVEGEDFLSLGRGTEAPLYRNVTGFVGGEWVRSKLDDEIGNPNLNLSDYMVEGPFGAVQPVPLGRNITGKSGRVELRLHEQNSPSSHLSPHVREKVTALGVDMVITDYATSEEYDLRLFGVAFPSIGQAVLATTSDKFGGIFMVPHLTLSEDMFVNSRMLLNESISEVVAAQRKGEINTFWPWASRRDGAADSPFSLPDCELVVYLQQLPSYMPGRTIRETSSFLGYIEDELREPTGAFLPSVPPMRVSMLAFSPNCGFILESKGPPDYAAQDGGHLVGSKVEVTFNRGRQHILIFNVALAIQFVLLIRQMREANTPSTQSRISFHTIAMLAFGDGFVTMTFLLTSIFVNELWINLTATAFLSFISVSFFGMRFLMEIWTAQAPERIQQLREQVEEEIRRLERARDSIRRLRELQTQIRAQNRAEQNGQVDPVATDNETRVAGGQNNVVAEATQSTVADGSTRPPVSSNAFSGAQSHHRMLPALPANQAQIGQPAGDGPRVDADAVQPTGQPQLDDTGATPVFMPSDQAGLTDVDLDAAARIQAGTAFTQTTSVQNFGSLYTRFYLLLLVTLFLSLNAASWPMAFRRVYFTCVSLIYLSFWIPQVRRNVQRNCRRALNWEYVLGQSALRIVPFVYFYGYANNALFVDRDLTSLALMTLWVWIQVVMLGSQEVIGPRWFVRKDWVPPAYDYHPVLRDDEEAGNMPIGFSQAAAAASAPTSPTIERRASLASSKDARERPGKRIFDCAICMQDLEVPIVAGDSSLGAGMLARRAYMVTPCRHIFHSVCLEGWMKFRLQCPICRETLPPL